MQKNEQVMLNELVKPLVESTALKGDRYLEKDRILIPLIVMVVQGTSSAVGSQVRKALSVGIAPETILEVVYQLNPVVGLLKVQDALTEISAVFSTEEVQVKKVTSDDDAIGAEVQAKLYGTEIKTLLSSLPDNAGDFLADALTNHFFRDYYGRPGLSAKDRERFELMALITLNVDFQINAHALGSLKAGNTESELVWSTIQMLPYIGFPMVINSVQKIHAAAQKLAAKD